MVPPDDALDPTDASEDENLSDGAPGDLPDDFSVRFVRVVRTESSEVFLLWQEDERLGQVDLHYGWDLIHATLVLEKELSPDQQAELVDLLDQEIVSSHLPRFTREDFLVTVFQGRELEPFSDGPDQDEFDEEDDFE